MTILADVHHSHSSAIAMTTSNRRIYSQLGVHSDERHGECLADTNTQLRGGVTFFPPPCFPRSAVSFFATN